MEFEPYVFRQLLTPYMQTDVHILFHEVYKIQTINLYTDKRKWRERKNQIAEIRTNFYIVKKKLWIFLIEQIFRTNVYALTKTSGNTTRSKNEGSKNEGITHSHDLHLMNEIKTCL